MANDDLVEDHHQHQGTPTTNTSSTCSAVTPLLPHGQQDNSRTSTDGNAAADDSVPFIDDKDGLVEQALQHRAPRDKLNLVFLITLLHGIGMLLPWNTFLTIGMDYFVDYKLANVSSTEAYKANFFNYLTICAQIPNLLLNLLNLFVVIKGGLYRRIYGTLGIIIGICLVTIVMIYVNTQSWPFGFFMFTMATIILLNSANGIYQNSVWGLVADFPGSFTNAIVLGNNFCGILMVVMYILIIVFVRAQPQLSALVYFGLALLTVLCCMATFHFLPRLDFYKYHVNKAAKSRMQKGTDLLHESEEAEVASLRQQHPAHPSLATYIAIFKEAKFQLLDVWLVFFTTLALFPTILLKVELYPHGRQIGFIYSDMETSEKLYRQLTIFLNFNLFATVGSLLAGRYHWPSPNKLTIPLVLRLAFLPLFWLCNYAHNIVPGPRQFVLIKNEWVFILLITLMSLTHGYWSSLAMIYAPKVLALESIPDFRQVDVSKSQVVGMMAGFFLVLGIASGISFTFVEPYIAYGLDSLFSLMF